MDMTMRAMNPAERNYCYAQSQQISMQTGLIGHLRADMDSSGTGFFSSFFNFRADLKTEDFKTEFDAVINALRFDESYGGILKDRSALSSYCHGIPESSFGGDGREFGFRVDTKQYSYMLRLNPNRGTCIATVIRKNGLTVTYNRLKEVSASSICIIRNSFVSRMEIKSELSIQTEKKLIIPVGTLMIIMWKSEAAGTVCFIYVSLQR